jgi:hypothetical protein
MKKFALLLCLLVAVVGLTVACGDGGIDVPTHDGNVNTPRPNAPDTNTPAVPPAEGPDGINWDEHTTFTWWMLSAPPNDYWNTHNDNAVINYIEQKFNITLAFEEPVVGTEGDSLALLMGTGQYTDAIHLGVYPGSITQLYEDGIIVDIAQWLDYMPTLKNLIETDPEIARGVFDDDGRILTLPEFAFGTGYPWAGFVYRHDILETATGGNIAFPSGGDVPTTIADWEYMLPLMLSYFEASGRVDYAPFIIPFNGTFHWGDLLSSFGAYHLYYIRDGIVHAGMLESAMFTYVQTMRDWFEKGWIYKDFASRTTDMFFMPNNELVFGGAASMFFGFEMHLGDRLSMPDFGMFFDVRPIPSPRSEGVTSRDMLRRSEHMFGQVLGTAVSTSNPDIGKFLAVMDYFYSEEGALTRTIGLHADQIPSNDTIMSATGMTNGGWWLDGSGNIEMNPMFEERGGSISRLAVNAGRMPGIYRRDVVNSYLNEEAMNARAQWGAHDAQTEVHPLPPVLSPTVAEANTLAANDTHITDLMNQMIPSFIMGTVPLNNDTWTDFIDQLKAFGLEENRDIWQVVYDRYLARG